VRTAQDGQGGAERILDAAHVRLAEVCGSRFVIAQQVRDPAGENIGHQHP
jgi:hypothetical protein